MTGTLREHAIGDTVALGRAPDRASAHRFARTHVAPAAGQFERDGRIPDDLLDRMSDAGLWAPFLPVEYGGHNVDMVTLGHIHEEVGRACSSVRSLLTVHTMVASAVDRWGDREQRERWLPRLALGSALGAFCLTEPEVGSDATGITTTAVRKGEGWLLNGVKKWITGGRRADVFLVFARTERGIGAFLVPRGTSGLTVTPIDEILGTKASMLAEVSLRDVIVGADSLLGPDGFAAGMVMTGTLDVGRYSVAAGSVGIVQACLDACTEYTTRRTIRSTRLRDFQLIQAKVSNMVVDVHAARLLYEHAGRLKDAGDAATILATWRAKYFASTAAARHATQAVQIHGANGCSPDYPVERYFRDAKVMEIIEGSTEIQQITIAEHAYREGAA
jgi:alkylation response protein AidB-like acyl-CoA dehydrogenase